MEIIIYALIIILIMIIGEKVRRLKNATDEDRERLMILLKEKHHRDMENFNKRVDEFTKELENRNKQTYGKKKRSIR